MSLNVVHHAAVLGACCLQVPNCDESGQTLNAMQVEALGLLPLTVLALIVLHLFCSLLASRSHSATAVLRSCKPMAGRGHALLPPYHRRLSSRTCGRVAALYGQQGTNGASAAIHAPCTPHPVHSTHSTPLALHTFHAPCTPRPLHSTHFSLPHTPHCHTLLASLY